MPVNFVHSALRKAQWGTAEGYWCKTAWCKGINAKWHGARVSAQNSVAQGYWCKMAYGAGGLAQNGAVQGARQNGPAQGYQQKMVRRKGIGAKWPSARVSAQNSVAQGYQCKMVQCKGLGASHSGNGTGCKIIERYPLHQTTPCSISKTSISSTLRQCYESKVTLALRPKGSHAYKCISTNCTLHKGIQQM